MPDNAMSSGSERRWPSSAVTWPPTTACATASPRSQNVLWPRSRVLDFDQRQRLVRLVIEEVKVTGWQVEIRLRIPLDEDTNDHGLGPGSVKQ